MKKVLVVVLAMTTLLFADISLTGEYSKELGNPFKKLLNKNKSKSINIYSKPTPISLKVVSNLDYSEIANQIMHQRNYIIENQTIQNVMEDFFEEEYIVRKNKSFDYIEMNILSGKIDISYVHHDNTFSSASNPISKIEVTLEVEIIEDINNKVIKKIETVTMDNKLGVEGDNYNWTIRATFDFDVKDIKSVVQNIIEHELYLLISRNKIGVAK